MGPRISANVVEKMQNSLSLNASCKWLRYPSSFLVHIFQTFLYQLLTQRQKVLLCDLSYSRFTHVTKMLEECHILKHDKHYTSIILNHKDMNKHNTELSSLNGSYVHFLQIKSYWCKNNCTTSTRQYSHKLFLFC
jgi:hypothetical protein